MENKNNLREQLSGLKLYEPSEKVWDSIKNELGEGNLLQAKLMQLPVFEPSGEVWEELEINLRPKKAIKTWQWAIAASVMLVACFLIFKSSGFGSNITISEQQVDEFKVLPKLENEDANYGKIIALCTQKVEVCKDPEFKELRSDFEQLKTASEELRAVMGAYNTKSQLLDELQKIEDQKAALIIELNRFI